MVHADASNFDAGLSKQEVYDHVLMQAEGLFDGQRNWVCNLANTASLLWHAYKSLDGPGQHVNWAGFYTVDAASDNKNQLLLGPFQGKVACQVIAVGKGVCGAAAARRATVLVPDVDQFPGHIACDSESKSEIVVPILSEDALVAIIDLDCAVAEGFDTVDQANLERLAALLGRSCDW